MSIQPIQPTESNLLAITGRGGMTLRLVQCLKYTKWSVWNLQRDIKRETFYSGAEGGVSIL